MSYIVQHTESVNGSFRRAVDRDLKDVSADGRFIRSWSRRSTQGWASGVVSVTITKNPAQARTWATRAGAQGVADRFTNDYNTYVVVEQTL